MKNYYMFRSVHTVCGQHLFRYLIVYLLFLLAHGVAWMYAIVRYVLLSDREPKINRDMFGESRGYYRDSSIYVMLCPLNPVQPTLRKA